MRTVLKMFAVCVVVAVGACNCDDESGNNAPNSTPNNANNANNGSNNANNTSNNANTGGPNNTSGPNNQTPNSQTQQEYCDGEGPPVLANPSGGSVCTGAIAAVSFRYAVCTCEQLQATDEVRTDSFDSSQGPYNPNMMGNAGSVGINGTLTHTNKAFIGGSLWVAGGQLTLTDEYDIAGELRVDGDVTSTSELTVGLDSYITGDANLSTYNVGGEHHQPAANNLMYADGTVTEVREPVTVSPPCDCDPNQLLDIDGFIDFYRTTNDNDAINLQPDALTTVTEDTTLELSCGRFFLDEITGTGEITITAQDRTALFIGGDIQTTNNLRIELAPGAELDLFVAGTFTSTNQVDFGSVDNPANVRMYLGGDDDMTWTGDFSIGGNIYAPEVDLTLTDDAEIFGSLFVKNLTATNKLTVHYDREVLNAGDECTSTGTGGGGDGNNGTNNSTNGGGGNNGGPDMCMDCRDCLNQSCNDGVCGSCDSNDDCCAPLLCLQGQCGVID